jgi:aspartate aminotransferase
MTIFAKRTLKLVPSPTLAITAKANALKAKGVDIIGLGAGEPDFPAPAHVSEAAIQAVKDGKTRYTPIDGTLEMKQAVVDKFARENKLDYGLDQVIICTGAKQALFNVFLALVNPGDEVIVPTPCWVTYPAMNDIAEGVLVPIETHLEQHFKITPSQLEAAITDKTKLLILNSPSNPTGSAYSCAELKALGEVLLKHPHVNIISDDIYEHIVWADEPFHNILNACPDLKDRTFVVNGLSKAYCITGWRIGYIAGPKDAIAVMKKIQSHQTANPCSIAQAAGVAALNGDQSCVHDMCEAFHERHDFLTGALSNLDGFKVTPSAGTFYTFANVQAVIDRLPNIQNDLDFAALLLEEAKVAIVPGSAFLAPGYIRFSYAVNIDTLQQAVDRIHHTLSATPG